MPRVMPPLASQFGKQVDSALLLAEAGETIRTLSKPKSRIGNALTVSRLEALYEMAYLRIFLAWEVFLEESFVRSLCGYHTVMGPPDLIVSKQKSLADARIAMLGTSYYVTWASPHLIVIRCQRFLRNSGHETVVASNQIRLKWFAATRHRIAHSSAHAKSRFGDATMNLAGRRYRGA